MFEKGVNVTSERIEKILPPESLTPTRVSTPEYLFLFPQVLVSEIQNAFSERLLERGFNFYETFVPDLLHEFELGVYNALFTHLLRILYACGEDKIQILK
jgi:hypothetical protein